MSLDKTRIIEEVSVIIGDLAGQWSETTALLRVEDELKSTLEWLTAHNIFRWNLRDTTLAHTNGVMAAPANMGKILQIIDTDGNENYYLASHEEYFNWKYDTADRVVTYDKSANIPYYILVDELGVETIVACTFANTTASRQFNIQYTVIATDLEAWIPERLRPFLISYTASQMLIKLENPDTELIGLHNNIARDNFQREKDFSANRGIIGWKTNLGVSPNMVVDIGGSAGL